MYNKLTTDIKPLGFTWETKDPFLFCVHHLDNYPEGNDELGPAASLAGRNLGQDFITKDGWRMYHGEVVPGFPAHPHRGFETVTVVLNGFVDHSDSHGAADRYGNGMEANAHWTLPAASLEANRSLYFYKGSEITITGIKIESYHSIDLLADQPVIIDNGNKDAYLLLLQGIPINEPVVQHGPFVMNSAEEIQDAFNDYRKTQFGGWPWSRYDNVHSREIGRFAKYSDGREEIK